MTNVNQLLMNVKTVLDEIKVKFNLNGELEILESVQLDGSEIGEPKSFSVEEDKFYLVSSGNFDNEMYLVSIVSDIETGNALGIIVIDDETGNEYDFKA